MEKLPKFVLRSRGPLRPDENTACRVMISGVYPEMERLLQGTGHLLCGRLQKYRGVDCPCVYIFYNQAAFDDEQRGIMYFLQDLEDGGFEVVFREWKGQSPINRRDWNRLADPIHDDRYRACSANAWKWRAFQIRSESDFEQALNLVTEAKATFEHVYRDALQ
ncbi:MAG: hypothetical protein JRJ85_24765 [Deltaproteobacteria bacterium]|nr:hypothetical protein [Deltaproteobacteria bacterium]